MIMNSNLERYDMRSSRESCRRPLRSRIPGRAHLILPLLLAAAWTAACNETDTAPIASPLLLETGADRVAIGLQTVITRDGVNAGEVFADTAFFYDDSTTYLLSNPVLTLFTEQGVLRARVTAEKGRMDLTTDELNAQGDVVLTIVDGNRRVESQELNYAPGGDRIWSDSFTVLHEQGSVLEGMGFSSDLDFRQLRVGPGSIRRTGPGGGGLP